MAQPPVSTSASYRAIVSTPASFRRSTAAAFLVAGLVFFAFEATKSLIFPVLSLWESHWITIAFGACVAAIAAYAAMRRQGTILASLAT